MWIRKMGYIIGFIFVLLITDDKVVYVLYETRSLNIKCNYTVAQVILHI
jgi:hypothetical protein